jgi:AAA+ ATPase superfamily predicted ATPase
MIRNINGPPAEDDDFYGRERESAKIWKELEGGNNILLLGPRRVGKSSMLRHLKKTAPDHGFIPVEISLADITEEIHFINRLYAAIGQHAEGKKIVKEVAGGPMSRFFRKIRKVAFWQASF